MLVKEILNSCPMGTTVCIILLLKKGLCSINEATDRNALHQHCWLHESNLEFY